MLLMTIDHSGSILDAHHMHGDNARTWVVGSPLPPGEFLTRWVTHLCAPVFVLLAGASLALSTEKRAGQPGQTAFLVKRGLLIAALDPIWMSLGFTHYRILVLQVLYAIGVSMILMAGLRRLGTRTLAAIALLLAALGELSANVDATSEPAQDAWRLLFTGGRLPARLWCAYPVLPWLSIMIAGWLMGRWMLTDRSLPPRARAYPLAAAGVTLLVLFAVVRGVDGYGNWGLHRDSTGVLQWLHVAKYPPSLAFMTLELGIGLLLLALFFLVDTDDPRPLLTPLSVYGATAFFYYLLHAHLLDLADRVCHFDHDAHGLANTYAGAAVVLLLLYPLSARYQRYKRAHPDGWTRYI
jgi:uncharacterized membrane protein